ncbi:resolvase [Sporanaerobium hydrogeniformans]|uniref:Resolvase n=1 Tax=Sporanaerobium hydrogeniformans TaxID=3072179 RepID=A0AC61D8S1_9FIRM|nr:recombinase family protein [Sporanaerobium hydrogeniformans]PHV69739.1 resolvase [Sporanaerobium hydrogeniformans]
MSDKLDKPQEVRVALYARVSTEEQALHGFSIEAQLNVLRNYCKLYNKKIVKEYVDRGISGKSIAGRYELQQLLKDAESGEFDEVLVWKISRLARKVIDLLQMVEIFEKNDVVFRSFSENFETETPMGKFALQMMGAVGELERNTIVDNVKLGMAQRSRQGRWNGGICLGYKSEAVDSSNKKDTRLVIVPEEATIIKKIFNMYASGKGLRAIANSLNKEGYKTKRGNTFDTASIKEIILNPLYVGKIRFNRYENWSERKRKGKSENVILADGVHEPIITQELWDRVQAIQKSKADKPMKNYEGNYILTGLMKCPFCGATMVGTRTNNKLKDGTKKVIRYYSCGAARSKGASVCGFHSIRADYAEQYVLDRINVAVTHPELLKKLVDKVNAHKKEMVKPLQEELQANKQAIEKVKASRDKYLNLFDEKLIDQELLTERLQELNQEFERLVKRQNELEVSLNGCDLEELTYEYVQEVMSHLNEILQDMPNDERKAFYHMIIEEIVVSQEKQIEVIKLKIDEEVQKEFIKQSPSETQSDGDIFIQIDIVI